MRTTADPRDIWKLKKSREMMVRAARFDDDSDEYEPDLDIVNLDELDMAHFHLAQANPLAYADLPLPPGFPIPQLSLADDYHPDFIDSDWCFVSKAMRDALRQPPEVVQYWPVDLVDGGPEAEAKEYMVMRVLLSQPALDLTRSAYTTEEFVRPRTGERRIRYEIREFIARRDLPDWPEIFKAREDFVEIYVTDALAERVVRADVDGVSFRDPEMGPHLGRKPQRLRTADGIFIEAVDYPEVLK